MSHIFECPLCGGDIAGEGHAAGCAKLVPDAAQTVVVPARDSFALAAMQGMLAHATRYKPRVGAPANWHDAISEEAYEIADAMLRARQA